MYPFPVSHFGREPLIELSINADVNDYNIFTEAQNAGGSFDPANNVTNGLVQVIIQNSIEIGSTSTATPAMTRGTGWGTGWDVNIVVQGTNSARITNRSPSQISSSARTKVRSHGSPRRVHGAS